MTLGRKELAAYEFLCLQADILDWLQRVLGRSFSPDEDAYSLCKSGELLCEVVNKMFPGCIKKYHKSPKVHAQQIENVALFIQVLEKMGLRSGTFEPLDLVDRKNVMRFLVALESVARFVNEKGFPIVWKENKARNFSAAQLNEAAVTYKPEDFAQAFAKHKAQQRKADRAKTEQAASLAMETAPKKALHVEESGTMKVSPDAMLKELDKIIEGGGLATTKLHLAVEHKLDPVVGYMVDSRLFDMRKPDGDGNTPLHSAVLANNEFALMKLLKGGANVNARNHEGQTPLHLAVAMNNARMVQALCEAGADLELQNQKGLTPLHVCADVGNAALLDLLLKYGGDVNARNQDGNTALHLAAWNGNADQVRMLKEHGADASILNSDGNSALHFGALRGHKAAVGHILEMDGANPNATNSDNATPLQLAAEADEDEVVSMMASLRNIVLDGENVRGWSPLYTAAYNGNRQMVNLLCKQGADPNHQNTEGWSAAHAAADQSHKAVVADLIEKYGSNVNVQTNEGTTPLFFAAQRGNLNLVQYLIAHGAQPSLGNPGGWQPIHGACYNDFDDVVSVLIKSGCRLNDGVDEIKGYAPIHIAIASEEANAKVVRMLLDAGANVNTQTSNGATALHLAIFWNSKYIVEYLLKMGARTDLRNSKNRRPIDLAVHYGNEELAALLAKVMGVPPPKVVGKAKPKVAAMTGAAVPPSPGQ